MGLGHLRRSMIVPVVVEVPAADGCPRCSAPHGIQRLLTSMVRYYLCGRCDWRWQVSRDLVHPDEARPRTP